MTDTERDELLIRLDESTKEIKNKLKALTLGKYHCSYRTKPVRR